MPRVAIVVAALVALSMPGAAATAQRGTVCRDREATASSIVIAPTSEPGERLVVTGKVLRGADRSPVAGARVLAFHTDAKGYYSDGGMDENNARLCGVLRTDAEGSFRIETIRPAHYATGGPPAHVHFEVTPPSGDTKRFVLNFEGDPLLGGRRAGERWEDVRPATQAADGTLAVERDLWIR